MRAFSQSQGLGIYAAVALLAGCGGGSQLGANPVQQNLTLPVAHLGRSWMAPEAKKHDLLYISNFYNSAILVFTYPGGKNVGSISSDEPQGECTSKTSNGNWWVVASGGDEILEYAHGGTSPIATLSENVGEPAACAIDPTTGNLAVSILGAGDVVIFAGAKGSGTTVPDGLSSTYALAFDNHGDLFVAGITTAESYAFVELPKGGSSFESITLHPNIQSGDFQWHDDYLAVGSTSGIYHFAIHGTKGHEIGFTPIDGFDVVQFWIQGGYVVGTDAGNENAEMWKYPAGGPIFKTLSGSFDLPIGVTVSLAK
jgi:hypothetical protein